MRGVHGAANGMSKRNARTVMVVTILNVQKREKKRNSVHTFVLSNVEDSFNNSPLATCRACVHGPVKFPFFFLRVIYM